MNLIDTEPWKIPLAERCSYLSSCIEDGYKIAIILYTQADTSTFRYRGYNIFQCMKDSKKWRVVYFFGKELASVRLFLKHTDLFIISRMQWSNELNGFIDEVKRFNIPLFFDCDDRVFDLDYVSIVTNTLGVLESELFGYWIPYIARHEMVAKLADGYIATNEFLADAFKKRFSKSAFVIPNFLNAEQIAVSNFCLSNKKKDSDNKVFTIGYFSGSPSHINDFKIVSNALLSLLEEFDDIVVKVVGFMEFPSEMQKYIANGRIVFSPLVDFVELQRLIASVDVNIVPLVLNDFTNCKSELKFFEAAICDTLTIASKSFTYRNCIKNGENGFLCSPNEWYSTLKDIYLGKFNLPEILKSAHNYAIENYSGEKIMTQIENVYDTCLQDYSQSEIIK